MAFAERKLTVVFDLDDTLVPERDCVRSGMRAVGALCREIYGVEVEERLMRAVEEGHRDPLGLACEALGHASLRESLLWTYRLHRPNIKLAACVQFMLTQLQSKGVAVAILTDGRSISQRAKINALGLDGFPVYISEEWESAKPETKRFKQVMLDFPAERYIYVGDNPAKDFLAPNMLGWCTIWFRGTPNPIHSQSLKGLPAKYHPSTQIEHWEQLSSALAI